jgi:tripartite-type tricarboxylate transporter receptor subunit TctC
MMRAMRTAVLGFFAVYLLPMPWPHATAQAYPNKPVRMIAASVGAGADVAARLLAPRLNERWGQPVVVDNRPGAGSTIAATAAAQATADGYTLLMGEVSSLATFANFYKVPYEPARDFAPVTLFMKSPLTVMVHPSLPVKTLQDFVLYAKQRPGAVNYGTGAIGTPSHLGAALLGILAGIDMVVVPYKGGGAALTAIMGREVQLLFNPPFSSASHVKSGRLSALAVTGRTRVPELPEVPTSAEAGLPGLEVWSWYGIVAPIRTPPDIVARVNRDVTDILRSPEFKALAVSQGAEPSPTTPKEFAAWIENETAKWTKVIKTLNIKPE